jgi:hypothetical protein
LHALSQALDMPRKTGVFPLPRVFHVALAVFAAGVSKTNNGA